jgi:hypothetical protein
MKFRQDQIRYRIDPRKVPAHKAARLLGLTGGAALGTRSSYLRRRGGARNNSAGSTCSTSASLPTS